MQPVSVWLNVRAPSGDGGFGREPAAACVVARFPVSKKQKLMLI